MPLASAIAYVKGLLDGLQWPEGMQNLTNPPPPLRCFIQPPNPWVEASTPTAFTWFEDWNTSRGNDPLRAGTIPRAAYQGGPSGTKTTVHNIPLYVVWMAGSPTDPYADSLFPGMLDAIQAVLEVAPNPAVVADPWTGVETQLVNIGETIRGHGYLRDTEPQQMQRVDALLICPITEIRSG